MAELAALIVNGIIHIGFVHSVQDDASAGSIGKMNVHGASAALYRTPVITFDFLIRVTIRRFFYSGTRKITYLESDCPRLPLKSFTSLATHRIAGSAYHLPSENTNQMQTSSYFQLSERTQHVCRH